MNTTSTLKFKKQRELGDMITDTFKFIRENYKILWRLFIKTVLLSFIFLIGATVFYNYTVLDATGAVGVFAANFSSDIGPILLALLVMLVAVVAYMSTVFSMFLHSIDSYNKTGGEIIEADVVAGVKQDFGKMMGLNILFSLMVGLGLALCVIPGLYVFVPLTLIFPIAIFENKSVSDSISDSFQLIKEHWWITFATLLIFGILIYIVSLIFQVPLIFYFLFKGITMSQEISPGDGPFQLFDTTYLVLTIVASVFQYLLYGFYPVISALIYFNIRERKYFSGTIETIDTIGKTDADNI